jgi:TatD DNase family protein
MPTWVDTHCHLNEEAFAADLTETVARARAAGVAQMLVIGCTLASSRRAVALAEQFTSLFAVVGIQPNYVHEAGPDDFTEIARLAESPRVVGLGETGLDRYWDFAPLELQRDYFRRHLALSRERGLPFVVHCREAEADVVAELERAALAGPLSGVMHSFTGDQATASRCLELGMHLSFAGMVTFKRNLPLRDVAAKVPAERILVETDAPYLMPSPIKNDKGPRRNEPAYVIHTGQCLATARGVSLDDFAAQTTRNARALFRLPELVGE